MPRSESCSPSSLVILNLRVVIDRRAERLVRPHDEWNPNDMGRHPMLVPSDAWMVLSGIQSGPAGCRAHPGSNAPARRNRPAQRWRRPWARSRRPSTRTTDRPETAQRSQRLAAAAGCKCARLARRGHHVSGLRPVGILIHGVGGRTPLDVNAEVLVQLPGQDAELAQTTGMSVRVSEHTMPGSTFHASAV